MQIRIVQELFADLYHTPGIAVQRAAAVSPDISKIGYVGWVGHNNLGDEAVFQAVRTYLAPDKVLPLLPAPGERLLAALGAGGAHQFRAVVFGGGTLIHQSFLPVAKVAASWSLPLYVAGTGVGSPGFAFPPDDQSSLREWVETLRLCPLVGVRGPRSAELLDQAGLGDVEVIGDPALAFTAETLPPMRSQPRLVLNLGPDNRIRAAGVALAARAFLRSGGEVVGVCLGAGDQASLLSFRLRYGLNEMRIESHRTSTERLLQTLTGSVAVITVRLHAAVLAACVGVPSILFAYRSKCLDFMRSLDLDEFGVPVSVADDAAALEELLRRIDSQPVLRTTIHRSALAWSRKQQNFFLRLRELLHP